ncbi:aconitate hydratase [Clostridium acetobutylicum]|uniref:Aconitase A n=1 Tax=Clostridium acetobutylicum (strain ATCC 824 / DSM 792 / JCM 1419 / IAM 19013 / LMG 5710 / NBRC 13948 / NRRL B-527 / VKM B-1787 / 2291 / W) TaxID=272562 RepID=Q97KE8_CLOAB|nr:MULTISPECIES: aconitate hydratase [Clostridium]AAK78947.1 Aconitase A [Clostridium acetobutylicum ATCC 824]ADZ20021.1 aconitate hydratase [Clostridium acetobutylicum EA 2018]AEI33246.1 aconitate hydratase [Clostridium acetobutylicum DSM 1731]AWV81796.1 aconitate hydratase [Clostridium acetobutylicum]MBC2395340.1 aconitate hydratase [Clostridium acetobutylicum]
MGLTLTEKIIKSHLVSGEMTKGNEIGIRIDNTLTQDSTGTMAYLQFEALGIDQVKTKRSVAYIDHNILQTGPENADDHLYIQTVAKKHGIYFSKPGNGICHQVNLERFDVPGETLIGSDSHTPTAGGMGMLAIGAGGLDVAVAMGGGEYYIINPKVVKVNLKGKLNSMVSAKDIILEVLRQVTVKGGVGKVFEYCGEGVKSLSIPERATICNMGAELGATTSIFPSDEKTKEFLQAQGRVEDFKELSPDSDAVYDEEVVVDLDKLEPLVACPHSPDKVEKVSEIKNIKVNQIAIGSCTNSSFLDLMRVSEILKGKTIHEDVSLVIAPGSKQVLTMMSKNGALANLVSAGARILECACGPCIGMGQSPSTDAVSLRTFNRNFEGRSGTVSAKVYLVSPETAAVSALTGVLTDPRELKENIEKIEIPEKFLINDNLIVSPSENPEEVEIVRGPNIKPFPKAKPLASELHGKALIKVEDNITTDHIMPSNAKLLPFRSNIPHLADFCLTPCDKEFPKNAKENNGGFIIAGSNYGQGSSREHAALAPLYLGIKAVLAKSFARIHKANLINNGIIPLVFENEADYDKIDKNDELQINDTINQVQTGFVYVENISKNSKYKMILDIPERQKDMLICGGKLNQIKKDTK